MRVFCLVVFAGALGADGPGVIHSRRLRADFEITADLNAKAWQAAETVHAENGPLGDPVPGHRMTIRSVWTPQNLYIHFTCPYEQLYLKPNPTRNTETNKLWEWDVAEVFVGWDVQNIHQYKEFQVSPQGEWVDLDIDRKNPKPETGWTWNSGFTVDARVDEKNKVWYGAMKIPLKSIDPRPAAEGNELRINFYRIQSGPAPNRKFVAWQPTNSRSYHVPEAFGRLKLVK
jgi:hypothetical protein